MRKKDKNVSLRHTWYMKKKTLIYSTSHSKSIIAVRGRKIVSDDLIITTTGSTGGEKLSGNGCEGKICNEARPGGGWICERFSSRSGDEELSLQYVVINMDSARINRIFRWPRSWKRRLDRHIHMYISRLTKKGEKKSFSRAKIPRNVINSD